MKNLNSKITWVRENLGRTEEDAIALLKEVESNVKYYNKHNDKAGIKTAMEEAEVPTEWWVDFK